MQNLANATDKSNTSPFSLAGNLSVADRRELLRAYLRLLSNRLRHNIPVLQDDVVRMLPYVDDTSGIGAGA